jgi:hypothetical protein
MTNSLRFDACVSTRAFRVAHRKVHALPHRSNFEPGPVEEERRPFEVASIGRRAATPHPGFICAAAAETSI